MCFLTNTCTETYTELCLGFLFSFLLHYAKFLFWLNCHFPTSHVWEPKGPWVNINETLGPMIMVIASVYVTWVKDTVQPVWEKDILDGRKMDLVPQSHPYSWHNHVQGRWAFVIDQGWVWAFRLKQLNEWNCSSLRSENRAKSSFRRKCRAVS